MEVTRGGFIVNEYKKSLREGQRLRQKIEVAIALCSDPKEKAWLEQQLALSHLWKNRVMDFKNNTSRPIDASELLVGKKA